MNPSQNYPSSINTYDPITQKSKEDDSHSDTEKRISWPSNTTLTQKKFFQKSEKPTVSLTEQEVFDNKESIMRSMSSQKKLNLVDRKDIDNVSICSQSSFQERTLWEVPKRRLISSKQIYSGSIYLCKKVCRR